MGGGVERFVFVSMLVDKVVGCLIEASFQQKEWGSTSETNSLSRGYAYEVLSFGWVGERPTQRMGKKLPSIHSLALNRRSNWRVVYS